MTTKYAHIGEIEDVDLTPYIRLAQAIILQAIKEGAGTSRMFEVRGPIMVKGRYDKASMKIDLQQKDISIIQEFAQSHQCPTPLLTASSDVYAKAMELGFAKQDTASVCAVLEKMAGVKRALK